MDRHRTATYNPGSTSDAAFQPDPASSQHIQARPGTTTGAERGAAPAAAARDRHLAAAGGEHRHLCGDGHRRRGDPLRFRRGCSSPGARSSRPKCPTANGGACSLRRSSMSTRCTSRSTCSCWRWSGRWSSGWWAFAPSWLSISPRDSSAAPLSLWVHPLTTSVGASGSIIGLYGVLLAMMFERRRRRRSRSTSRRRSYRVCSCTVICSPPSR